MERSTDDVVRQKCVHCGDVWIGGKRLARFVCAVCRSCGRE